MGHDEQYSADTAFLADIVGGIRNHVAIAHKTGDGADYEFTYIAPQDNRALLVRRLTTKLGEQGLTIAENASYIDDKICYRVTLRGHAAQVFRGFLTQHLNERHGVEVLATMDAPVVHFGVVRDGPRAKELFAGIDGEVKKNGTEIEFVFMGVHTGNAFKTLTRLLGTDAGLTILTQPDAGRATVKLHGEAAVKFLALEHIHGQMKSGHSH